MSLAIIATTFDPTKAASHVKLLFFGTLFVLISSVGTAMFFYLSRSRDNHFEWAFKSGLLISIGILFIVLGLRSFNL